MARRTINRKHHSRKATCEIYSPISGGFIGYWHGTEDQLMSGCCPCPGGACLPACCDLHDF